MASGLFRALGGCSILLTWRAASSSSAVAAASAAASAAAAASSGIGPRATCHYSSASSSSFTRLLLQASSGHPDARFCSIEAPTRSYCTPPPPPKSMTMDKRRGDFIVPTEQSFELLDAQEAFAGLTVSEQLYAHHIARASFFGGLAVLVQTSPESPAIYRLIQKTTAQGQSPTQLKEKAMAAGVSEEHFKAFLLYASGVLANMGNYKGFGDSKILPGLPQEAFEKILKCSKVWDDKVQKLWMATKERMYSLTERQAQLGLAEKGVTTYHSDNITQEDSDRVNHFFKHAGIEGYMNRLFKHNDGHYEIRHPGITEALIREEEFEGVKYKITRGDYGPLMALVNQHLKLAEAHASNEYEKKMLECYQESFATGSLDNHKNGSRFWIKNKGPVVETYIGFIETYRDPVGMRGEFEGFVAMVNQEQSLKFGTLVAKAEELLPRLPWPKEFEKDEFLRPDFTSLDVLAFAGSGVPAGINIPNYDEIRQSEGFKNVNLGNVISSAYKSDKKTTFISLEDHDLFVKYRVKSFEVQVGLHELLGHGSGKLFTKEKGGALNFASETFNPLTGEPVNKYYDIGETFDSVFTSLGSSYEECRAECVGLYLSLWQDIVAIFNITDSKEQEDIIYVNWLSLLHAALKGLEMYSPATKEWKQAHSQARYVILRVLLEAGESFVTLKEVTGSDGKPDLLLTMDRSKLGTVGKQAIGEFLKKLQVFKSTGDIAAAKKMFDHFSDVLDDGAYPFARWRDIIVARKVPRKMLIQANTVLEDEKLRLITYEANAESMLQSWADRFSPEEHRQIDEILAELTERDRPFFTNTN